ncbi:pyridoxine biosynthesis 2 [Actinidia rufa]|uniref:glutaminase n=1 Tax=Actinidia rufa TaxID=165716 RepID=A0A7J0H4N3_9ERIC|nr:pyridoxine biosynthesis 2 [Actinidia rufa]
MAIGVLALQGLGVKGVEIRKPDQLQSVTSLIIPGGESTTMAKLAEYHNLGTLMRHSTIKSAFMSQESTAPGERVIVAVKQGNLLGTAFHPELTADTRWHSYFLKMVDEIGGTASSSICAVGEELSFHQPKIDLPIFQQYQ